VFTDEPNVYYNIFEDLPPKVIVLEAIRGKDFQFEDALSQWSGFQNREVLGSFEVDQLNVILKKFVK